MNNRDFGNRGEQIASNFLEDSGYQILARNYTVRAGELDIVAQAGETIVFVEVKTRRSGIERPAQAVTPAKIGKLSRAALRYLSERGWLERDIRFDVIEIVFPGDSVEINHIPAAFLFDSTAIRR